MKTLNFKFAGQKIRKSLLGYDGFVASVMWHDAASVTAVRPDELDEKAETIQVDYGVISTRHKEYLYLYRQVTEPQHGITSLDLCIIPYSLIRKVDLISTDSEHILSRI
jgi:hypothetical protein